MLVGEALIAPQPGGRPPAPGRLALVQLFMNSYYDLEVEHGAELLATPAALTSWLRRHKLIGRATTADSHDLERALTARKGLRALAAADANGTGRVRALRDLDGAARNAALTLRFAPDGPEFVAGPDAGVGGAIATLLAVAAQAMIDGSWSRLKLCPGRDCGWAFYDHSRNQAGRWCSMSVCGGREKARAHYRRNRTRR